MPLVRTAPVPLYLLAREVREQRITVVATGEGADELFWGYELFKEVVLRELHRRDPERAVELLDQLYAYLGHAAARRGPAWRRFLLETGADDELLGSHLTRAEATATVKAFYRPEVAAEIGRRRIARPPACRAPAGFGRWSRLERAAWLELATLLEPYLLSAQGDRVAMAHGVEGRFPFLDHRVFETPGACRRAGKLTGCGTRWRCARSRPKVLPAAIAARPKQPYRAPEVAPFFAPDAPSGWRSAVAGGPGARPRSGTRSGSPGCCGAAARAVRPACAKGWRWSDPLDPALASGVRRYGAARLPGGDRRAARQNRPHQRSHEPGGCMTEATGNVRTEMRATSRRTSSTCTRGSSSRTATSF